MMRIRQQSTMDWVENEVLITEKNNQKGGVVFRPDLKRQVEGK